MTRKYKGRPPDGGILIAECHADGIDWRLYIRSAQSTAQFWSLKLCANIAEKANYWLGWARAERRMTRNVSAAILNKHRPYIYSWVEAIMRAEQPSTAAWRAVAATIEPDLGAVPEPPPRAARGAKPAARDPETAYRTAHQKFEPLPELTPFDAAAAALQGLAAKCGRDAASELLARFGAAGLAGVPAERLGELRDAARAKLRRAHRGDAT